jgi:hypothetical protein
MGVSLWAASDLILNEKGMVGEPEAQAVQNTLISSYQTAW